MKTEAQLAEQTLQGHSQELGIIAQNIENIAHRNTGYGTKREQLLDAFEAANRCLGNMRVYMDSAYPSLWNEDELIVNHEDAEDYRIDIEDID